MKSLLDVIDNIFSQIRLYLNQLDDETYQEPLEIFSGSSIGQHTRHIIEFFVCLVDQLEGGRIDYDARDRKKMIEMNTGYAGETLGYLSTAIRNLYPPTSLQLVSCYGESESGKTCVETSLERELLYNVEHAVHHLAMIKIGLRTVSPEIQLPSDFGVAQSTLTFRNNVQSH